MNLFELYFKLGIDHIADFQGYDHILFIIALTIVYPIKMWKKLLILITAFTIGHSLTLVLATFNLIKVPTDLIEFLIPITIFITALLNTLQKSYNSKSGSYTFKYVAALFFGLIHGLGFSNFLKAMLSEHENLFMPLLAFNLGIEVGQIIIVLIITALTLVSVDIFGVKRRDWNLIFSGATMGISLILTVERFPW